MCYLNAASHHLLEKSDALQEHLLPEEYVQTMRRTTLDQCPVSPYSEVSKMITVELGSSPESLFASFEETPIASASLAQVISLRLQLRTGLRTFLQGIVKIASCCLWSAWQNHFAHRCTLCFLEGKAVASASLAQMTSL